MRTIATHGDGAFSPDQLAFLGENSVFETEVLCWHPETISMGSSVYVGHRTMLKGHAAGKMKIGDFTWIGQDVFLHSAGNLTIGAHVGIGPRVTMITSFHDEAGRNTPILEAPIKFGPIEIEDDVDIGVGAIILPGVGIGKGAQIGAGSVVTKNVEPYTVVAGNPARVLRTRPE